MKQFEAPWTIFFSWGAFVFLFVNFLTGIVLAKQLNFLEFILALFLGLVFLSLSLYAAIWISVKFNVNYSEAIYKFLSFNSYLKIISLFILLAVNMGWYSIQLEISISLIPQILEHLDNTGRLLITFLISYLFAFGAFKYEYSWLKFFGALAMIMFSIIAICSLLKINHLNILNIANTGDVHISDVLKGSLIVYGTWGFSSSTCIMDIAKYTNKFLKTFAYATIAILLADILLILFGYIFSLQYEVFSLKQIFKILEIKWLPLIIFISLWSTNDSNFFSSMRVIEKLGFNKKTAFLVLPAISAILVLLFKEDIFSILGKWLKFMGWTSVGFSILWWSVFLRYRRRVFNV